MLEIRMLEIKLEANFEDGLEDALKLKKKEYKEYLETAKYTLDNCFRPELLKFFQEVKFEPQQHWNFQSTAGFKMSETYRR